MIKRYCDCCGSEMLDFNSPRDGTTHNRLEAKVKAKNCSGSVLSVEVITGLNNTSNAGDFCKYCILDALYTLDDRK